MRFAPPMSHRGIHSDIGAALSAVRARRSFAPAAVLTAKRERLGAYVTTSGLRALVVGVSGGIDSAVSLGLAASLLYDGTLDEVVPVLLPVSARPAATGQDGATSRGTQVCTHFGLTPVVVELANQFDVMRAAVETATGLAGDEWAHGQLVAYMRTPALYYTTSLLSASGVRAAVLGTTNRDEGSYLGYFGKASDGMVDIQPLTDLHKSEVYALARLLGVPEALIDVIPTGDMYDGRTDEEVFGAPYDFVELFLAARCMTQDAKALMLNSLDPDARAEWVRYSDALEGLHRYNAHKYLVGSPAVHLDVVAGKVPGGWRYEVWDG